MFTNRLTKWAMLFSMLLVANFTFAQEKEKEREIYFNVGGFVKADVMFSQYRNGNVPTGSILGDFHFPSLIPVGGKDINYATDFSARESRLNLETGTTVNGKKLRAVMEVDFLVTGGGNEKISHSYTPRIRHMFVEYDKLLIGQTWTTFMIIALPDRLDFVGAADGTVFARQPQIRFTHKGWQFSIENPETTITPYKGGSTIVSGVQAVPDFVVRKNFSGKWGMFAVSGIYRYLQSEHMAQGVEVKRGTSGYGINTGGKFFFKNSDDFRFNASAGKGLGRYMALNYINGAVLDENADMHSLGSIGGYVSYLHHWSKKFRSSFTASGMTSDLDESAYVYNDENANDIIGTNKSAWSAGANLLYSPIKELTLGAEYFYAQRILHDGASGSMNRFQFSAKYAFDWKMSKKAGKKH